MGKILDEILGGISRLGLGRIIFYGIPMLIMGLYFQNVTPEKLERRLDIQLPESAVIENYEYSATSDRLYIKLSVGESDLEAMRDILVDYCKGKYAFYEHIPHFENLASWWDWDRDEIEFSYHRFANGKYGADTTYLFIFMAKDTAGEMRFWFVI